MSMIPGLNALVLCSHQKAPTDMRLLAPPSVLQSPMFLMNHHETTPLALELSDRIAPEIYDTIIDHLHSFKPALSSCSTVCKSWLPSCRYHLFHDINLSPKLAEFLCSSPRAMETVTPYIRNVTLGSAWFGAQRNEFDDVISLLLNIGSIRGLSLGERWNWGFLIEASVKMLLKVEGKPVQNITTLCLQYLRFPAFSSLVAFIGGFSMLEYLSFDHIHWNSASTSISASVLSLRPSRLKNLHIRSSLVMPILNWLFGEDDLMGSPGPVLSSLHFLTIPEVLSDEIHTVRLALQALGSTLHHLEIGFLDMANCLDVIDLSHNTNLRTMHVHHLTLYQFPNRVTSSIVAASSKDQLARPVSPLFWLVPILNNISSPAMIELVLYLWLSDERDLDSVDWLSLNQVLSRPVFGGLKTLQFRIVGLGAGRADFRGWLLARLSSWVACENVIRVLFLEG